MENRAYNDAKHAARTGAGIPPGRLVSVTERENGRDVTVYVGDPLAWVLADWERMGTALRWVLSAYSRPASTAPATPLAAQH